MEKRKRGIITNDERYIGCTLCALSCSLINFCCSNPTKSYITFDKDERSTHFVFSIDGRCPTLQHLFNFEQSQAFHDYCFPDCFYSEKVDYVYVGGTREPLDK